MPPVCSQLRLVSPRAILSSKSLRNTVRLTLCASSGEVQYSAISLLTLVSGCRSGLPTKGVVPWPPNPVTPSYRSVVLGVLKPVLTPPFNVHAVLMSHTA